MYCNTIHLPLQYTSSPLQYTFISLAIQSHPLHTQVAIQSVYCNTIFFFSHCTLLQYNSSLLQYTYPAYLQASLQYNFLYCKQFSSPTSLVAIQILVLQYNYLANKPPLAIQFSKPTTLPRLQYNFPVAIHLRSTALPQSLSHNTKLSITIQFGQWPKIVSTLPFFFLLLFFFHINFQLLENTKNNLYTYFFFIFQNTQINS